jgi:hypothetical protein
MTLAERVSLRCAVLHRVEPRVRGLVSFLLELDEAQDIPHDLDITSVPNMDNLALMLSAEFNFNNFPSKRAIRKWRTYSDLVLFVVKRCERFRR